MPLLCCVRNCKTNYEDHTPNSLTAFFKFPTDQILRNKWIENIGRQNWKPNSNSTLCMKHFTSDCIIEIEPCYQNVNGQYIKSNRVLKLKQGACPTIFKVPISRLTNNKKINCAIQSNEVIDLIDDPSPSVSVVTNNYQQSSTSSLVLKTSPQQETKMNDVSKSDEVQSNNNISKIVLLDDFKKTQGKTEEESEFIIDEVTDNLEEDLITAVYNREPLWRINKENQPDEYCLEILWKEVADEVGRSVLIVKEIWESLRHRFFQEQKVVEKSKFTYWPYYNQLWFLKLNNITAEQMAGTTSNEIISPNIIDKVMITSVANSMNGSTTTNNSIVTSVPTTNNNQPTTNGIIYPTTVVNLVRKPDIVLTATNNIIPTTNNILSGSNIVTLAPILATRTNVGATNITTTNVATNNIATSNVATTNVAITNVATTNVATNQNSNKDKNINSNEIIILDDEDTIDETPIKKKPRLSSNVTPLKLQQNSILKNLLTDQDEDLAYLKRILPRIKALSYNNRMKFRDDVLNSLRSLEKK